MSILDGKTVPAMELELALVPLEGLYNNLPDAWDPAKSVLAASLDRGMTALANANMDTAARLVGPMTRRIGQLGGALDELVRAIDAWDGDPSTFRDSVASAQYSARISLADNRITAEQVDHRAELDRWRKVIVAYVNQVESGEKFGALVDLVYDDNGQLR